ncbi:MAG: A24 family peptidase [Bacillota bacterium]|nr:A24 family peptidase [Bacillota bacterium]
MILMVIFIGAAAGVILNTIIGMVTRRRGLEAAWGQRYIKAVVICTSALLITISFLRFGFQITFLKASALDCILIVISTIDIEFSLIPDELTVGALAAGILLLSVGDITVIDAAAGMAAGGIILLMLALIPGAMGGGDVKIMAVLGLFLGLGRVIPALLLAFITSGIVSIPLLIFKLKGRRDHIPFGPFLILGSFISYHFLK